MFMLAQMRMIIELTHLKLLSLLAKLEFTQKILYSRPLENYHQPPLSNHCLHTCIDKYENTCLCWYHPLLKYAESQHFKSCNNDASTWSWILVLIVETASKSACWFGKFLNSAPHLTSACTKTCHESFLWPIQCSLLHNEAFMETESQCMCKQIYTQTVQLLPFMTPAARLQTIAAWSWKIILLHCESLDQHSKLLEMPLENWPIQTYLGQYQSDLQTPQLGYYFPLLPLCPEKLKLLLVLLLQQGCPGMTKTGWHAYQKSPTVAAQGQFHQQVHFGFVLQEVLL